MQSKHKDYFVFLIGCLASIPVSLIGRVYLGELLIFITYLFIPKKAFKKVKELKKLMLFAFLWLIGALVTDYYRQTPTIDMLKGAVSIIFLMSLIPFVYWALSDKITRWVYFFFGNILSSQITYYFITRHTEFGSAEIWQYYAYNPIVVGLSVLLYMKGRKWISCTLILVFGVWMLYHGSRNVFLCNSLAVIVILYADRFKEVNIVDKIRNYRKRFVLFLILVVMSLAAVDLTYEELAGKGHLGEEAEYKYAFQKSSDIGILSGRWEAVMDIELISKSPILGYGSYAKDYKGEVNEFLRKHNIYHFRQVEDLDSVENMLPRHSRIFGLWMWHGFFAGVFWLYVLFLIIRSLSSGAPLSQLKYFAMFVITAVSEIWDTLFSPMAVRLPLLFFLIYIILIEEQNRINSPRKKKRLLLRQNNIQNEPFVF